MSATMILPTRPSTPVALPSFELMLGLWDDSALLTYTSKQTDAQRARVNASVARDVGFEAVDGNTMADDLS